MFSVLPLILDKETKHFFETQRVALFDNNYLVFGRMHRFLDTLNIILLLDRMTIGHTENT